MVKITRNERVRVGMACLRKNQREALGRAMTEAAKLTEGREHLFECLEDIAIAAYQDRRKKQQDWESDHRTRTLVGLRVHHELAQMWKDSAEDQGKSLYQFMTEALNRQACPAGVNDCPPEGDAGGGTQTLRRSLEQAPARPGALYHTGQG